MKNKLLYLSVVIFLFLSGIASADDAAECLKLGKESNYTEAFQPCQNACNQKNGWVCSTLAYQYYTGQGTVQSYVHAKINFEKACNLNNGYGCFMVGALYNNGEGVIKSYKEAGRFFKKGCNLREANGCYELGYLYENPESNDHDYVNAGKYYKKACNLGQQKGCNAYKSINRDDSKDSTGTDSNKASYCVFFIETANHAKAVQFCRDECNHNQAQSCTLLGELYRNGKGIQKSYKKAGKYYKKACDLGNAEGCDYLGYLYENPDGKNHDYVKSYRYYKKACDLNSSVGCGNSGFLHLKGLGVQNNYTKAVDLYEKSCDLNYARGCYILGQLFENPENMVLDSAKAGTYYKKACTLGDNDACKKYQALQKTADDRENKTLNLHQNAQQNLKSDSGADSAKGYDHPVNYTHDNTQNQNTFFIIVVILAVGVITAVASQASKQDSEKDRNTHSDNSSDHRSGSENNRSREQSNSQQRAYEYDYRKKEETDDSDTDIGNPVFAELFALTGFVAKAQGVISREQIQEVTKAFNRLEVSDAERKFYQKKFNFGKSADFIASRSCSILASYMDLMDSEERKAFIFFSLDLLLPVVFADGIISDEEKKRLFMITRAFDINDYLINSIINDYIYRFNQADEQKENEIDRAFRILGLPNGTQFEEVKSKYRILIKKYHPDRVGLLHLSPEQEAKIREEYNQKSKEINEAFDILKTHFGQ